LNDSRFELVPTKSHLAIASIFHTKLNEISAFQLCEWKSGGYLFVKIIGMIVMDYCGFPDCA